MIHIGGWVRDMLLNRKQKKTDIDFVCVGSGIKLAEKVAEQLGKNTTFKVFKNFGTAVINFNGENYEFVGARKESYTSLSRNPKIEKGSIEDDQKRRDFTINAMAVSLSEKNYGDFFDPFNSFSIMLLIDGLLSFFELRFVLMNPLILMYAESPAAIFNRSINF